MRSRYTLNVQSARKNCNLYQPLFCHSRRSAHIARPGSCNLPPLAVQPPHGEGVRPLDGARRPVSRDAPPAYDGGGPHPRLPEPPGDEPLHCGLHPESGAARPSFSLRTGAEYRTGGPWQTEIHPAMPARPESRRTRGAESIGGAQTLALASWNLSGFSIQGRVQGSTHAAPTVSASQDGISMPVGFRKPDRSGIKTAF